MTYRPKSKAKWPGWRPSTPGIGSTARPAVSACARSRPRPAAFWPCSWPTPRPATCLKSAPAPTLWLALAARASGRTITTFEVLEEKIGLAKTTFAAAGVQDLVTLIHGDARQHLVGYQEIAFCFLDAEKEIYGDCYELVVPNLVPGGLWLADNAINHRQTLQPVIDRALTDRRVDALVVPVGKGLLLARKI